MGAYIRGHEVLNDEIRRYFISNGASNPQGLLCNNPDNVYFVDTDGVIKIYEGRGIHALSWEEVSRFKALDIELYLEKAQDLKEYRPENPHFTSVGEVRQIEEHLRIKKLSKTELRCLRDLVVYIFTSWMNEAHSKEESIEYMRAMQSITTVIDFNIYGIE